jgi:hypothetical protein
MPQVIVAPLQAQKIALEQIVLHESRLIQEERYREWRYRKQEDSDLWFADQIADLEAWRDYLDRKRREENISGLTPLPSPPVSPKSRPFTRYFAMLGDEAAGESMCDDIAALMIEIALIVSMQKTIGTTFGGHERQRRAALKKLQPVAVADSTGSDVILTRQAPAPGP